MTKDLPGFVFDTKTGRYYKTNVTGAPNFVTDLQRSAKKRKRIVLSAPKRYNLLSDYHLYQAGLKKASKMASEVIGSKVQQLQLSRVSHFRPSFECHSASNVDNYYYVAGRSNRLEQPRAYLSRYIKLDRIEFTYEKGTDPNDAVVKNVNTATGFVDFKKCKIEDLCCADEGILFIVNADHRRYHLNTAGIVSAYTSMPDEASIRADRKCWRFNKALRCCTYSPHSRTAALGTESNIVLLPGLLRTRKMRNVKDDVFSIDFSPYGFSLVYGTNKGGVYCADIRGDVGTKIIDIGSPVTQIKTLNDDNTLILSGYNDTLCCVDTRMQGIVMQYEGHCNDCKKIPLSVCEEKKIICSADDQNNTRFWGFNDSKPVATIAAPVPNSSQQAYSFVCSIDHRIYSHVFFGNRVYSYKPI